MLESTRRDLPRLRDVVDLARWEEFLAQAGDDALPAVSPGDIAQIQYTSGTTGFPKGAMLPHRGLVAVSRMFAEANGAGPGDVWINPMPMFHTAGCGLATLGALQTGGTHVLPPGFDPAQMLDLFQAERGTVMLGVPTMLIRLLDEQAVAAPRRVQLAAVDARRGAGRAGARRRAREGARRRRLDRLRPDGGLAVPHPHPAATTPTRLGGDRRAPAPGDRTPHHRPGHRRAPSRRRGRRDLRPRAPAHARLLRRPRGTAEASTRDGWLHTGDLGIWTRTATCRCRAASRT